MCQLVGGKREIKANQPKPIQLVAIVLQLQPKLFFFWLPLLQPSVIVVMAVILSASHKSHKNKIYFVR